MRSFGKKIVSAVLAGMFVLCMIGRYAKGIPVQAAFIQTWEKVDGVFFNSMGTEIEGAVLKGIDVSYHNRDIDWETVQATDVDYAILRCGYGQDFESQDDKKWIEYADACTELGIPFGTYLYSYATTVSAAKSEAQHVLRLIEGYQLTYPVYYDMEDSKQKGQSATRKAQIAQAFCSVIEEAGYQVGIYANLDWFTNYLTDSYFDTCDKWVAQYNYECEYTGDYRMWQCTSDGRVDGISTKVDINFWFDQPPTYQGNQSSVQNPAGSETTPNQGQTPSGTEPSNGNQTTNDPTQGNTGNEQTGDPTQGNTGNEQTGDPTQGNTGNEQTENASQGNSGNQQAGGSSGQISDNPTTEKPDENNAGNIKTEENLEISHSDCTLTCGKSLRLTANQDVKWSSLDKTIAKVGAKGKVTAVNVGNTIIKAVSKTGKVQECVVTVTEKINNVEIDPVVDQEYTGEPICPEPVITDDTKILVKDTDYELIYAANTDIGTAEITVQGKGFYTGTTALNFQIMEVEKPSAPVFTQLSTKKKQILLKWKQVDGADGYELYRTDIKKGTYQLLSDLTKKKYTDKKLKKGKKYYYKLRAYRLRNEEKIYGAYVKANIKTKL